VRQPSHAAGCTHSKSGPLTVDEPVHCVRRVLYRIQILQHRMAARQRQLVSHELAAAADHVRRVPNLQPKGETAGRRVRRCLQQVKPYTRPQKRRIYNPLGNNNTVEQRGDCHCAFGCGRVRLRLAQHSFMAITAPTSPAHQHAHRDAPRGSAWPSSAPAPPASRRPPAACAPSAAAVLSPRASTGALR